MGLAYSLIISATDEESIMANGNSGGSSSSELLRLGAVIIAPLFAIAVAWGSLNSELVDLQEDVKEIKEWINEWQARVLPLDAIQDMKIEHLQEKVDGCCYKKEDDDE